MKLFNTLTKQKEEFQPADGKTVKMYVCGPTVYGLAHLGHARTYIFFDLLTRYLKHSDYDVRYVQNLTDVGHLTDEGDEGEDKVIVEAKKQGKTPQEIADFFIATHKRDMTSLGNLEPEYVKATDVIAEIIEFVKDLIDKGFAYETGGSVYFDVSKLAEYGKLSGQNLEEMRAGIRTEVADGKRNPADFALWQAADEKHLMGWDSPWSRGYPGWHIECSTISSGKLGQEVDIHGGAIDLSFPHHENEIAQNIGRFGHPIVRFWVHTGLVTIDNTKMSKSRGNFITVEDLLKKYEPQVLRIWVMMAHYRSPAEFSENVAVQAQEIWNKIKRATENKNGQPLREYLDRFYAALDDDMNTPSALTVISELLKEKDAGATLIQMDDVLGLGLSELKFDVPGEVKQLADEREKARQSGDFELSDKLRTAIHEKGFDVEDTPSGPRVYKK